MNRFQFRVWSKETNSFLDSEYFKITGNGAVENYTNENENDTNCIIQQFTGVLDKNGEKIFEGDIVKEFVEDKEGDFNKFSAIKYVKGSFLVEEDDCSTVLSLYHNYIEVVGNVFENPELLK